MATRIVALLLTLVLAANAGEPECSSNPDDKTSSCPDTVAMLQSGVKVGSNLVNEEDDAEEAAEEDEATDEDEGMEDEDEAMDEAGDAAKGVSTVEHMMREILAKKKTQNPSSSEATVSLGEDGETLVYTPNDRGDVIPDFAHVGYKSDIEPLPTAAEVLVKATVEAKPSLDPIPVPFTCGANGDDTDRIQAAVDTVSALSPDDAGIRGAVLLGPGVFCVKSTIKINANGVVLRGSGDGESAGTILRAAGPKGQKVVVVGDPGQGHRRRRIISTSSGLRTYITNPYVPVGAFTTDITANSGGGGSRRRAVTWSVGDLAYFERIGTDQWIHDIGMDRIPDCTPPRPGRKCSQWAARTYNLRFERIVTAVEALSGGGNRLTFDAPIMTGLDSKYGQVRVSKATTSNRVTNVAVEHLRVVSDYDRSSETDENHARTAVYFDAAEQGWVNSITCKHLVFACVDISKGSKHITVKDSTSLAPISRITGGRRYSFNVDGQNNLVTGCQADHGRHDFVSGSTVAGPNVWANSNATNSHADIGPHMRWAFGQLYDNIQGKQFQAWDRGAMGSGHGWSGNTIVFYNCLADDHGPPDATNDGQSHRRRRRMRVGFTVSSPEGGANYCIGCRGEGGQFDDTDDHRNYNAKTPACCGEGGHFQSQGQLRTDIPSLYDMQLAVQKRRITTSASGR